MLTILFDGIAYGMLLFILACGLAVTLGLMNFVNLAHGAFAMAGGYCTVIMVNRLGIPFFAALPLAFLVSALIGFVFERSLYVHVYRKPHLDQVLFTIGLVFMSVAAVDYVMGSSQVFVAAADAIVCRFAPTLARRMKRMAGLSGEVPLDLSRAIRRLQRQADAEGAARRRQQYLHDDGLEKLVTSLSGTRPSNP